MANISSSLGSSFGSKREEDRLDLLVTVERDDAALDLLPANGGLGGEVSGNGGGGGDDGDCCGGGDDGDCSGGGGDDGDCSGVGAL
jgi:hypothetical protein